MGVIARRHPETWPCDGCGKNHADVYTMPSGDVLCVACELRERRALDHSQGAVLALREIERLADIDAESHAPARCRLIHEAARKARRQLGGQYDGSAPPPRERHDRS